MDDRALARAIAQRDPSGTQALLDAHHTSLYRFAFHLTRRAEDSEDLVQQALVRVLLRIDRFDGRVTLRTWMLAIVYREFLNWRRRRMWFPITPDRPSIDASFAAIIEAESLMAALATLSPSLRAAFLLFHVEELSVAEIAVALKIPEGTVKSRLHVARSRLRELLGEDNYANEP